MNPMALTSKLRRALVDYLMTTFDVNRDGTQPELAAALRRTLEADRALFNGPFLELTPPYVKGCTLQHLIDERILDPRLGALKCFRRGDPLPLNAPLYTHQEAAIRKLAGESRSVVVSSGTGSGKTEAFLIPILNDLLIDRTQGVRAVLIYPLNALVNDQLDRLRRLLEGTDITFGRYTSELPENDREAAQRLGDDHAERFPNEIISRSQIRDGGRLPQILITNYAMLEYLLLRPKDSPLFDVGAWRFLVLDEAHTYSGAKGIEVSMLIRRLKLRLNKESGDMRCVATSATLTDDQEQAATFARNLFDEPFEVSDIILSQVDRRAVLANGESAFTPAPASYLDKHVRELLDALSTNQMPTSEDVARYLQEAGVIEVSSADQNPELRSVKALLFDVLRNNGHLQCLRRWMLDDDNRDVPVELDRAADHVFGGTGLGPEQRQEALYRLIELGAHARPAEDKNSLLPARYHLFARPPQGVWVCLNRACPGREIEGDHPWSRLYTAPRATCDDCGCAVYPLAVCRTCGQVYIFAEERDGAYLSEVEIEHADQRRYFTWTNVRPDSSLAEDSDDEDGDIQVPQSDDIEQKQVELCLNADCRRTSGCRCSQVRKVTLYQVVRKESRPAKGATRQTPISELEECCRCRDKPSVAGTEIATPITLTGSAPVSVLAIRLYPDLPQSTQPEARQKPGEGRKLLTFYDSRQGAARFAAYLQDVFNQDLYRHLVPRAITDIRGDSQHPPDLRKLSERCVSIGWEEMEVFQNDLEIEGIERGRRNLSQSQRERLMTIVQERILAEITTARRSRQSLESLGLIVVDYFEAWPDVSTLAQELRMSEVATRALVRNLLDTVRVAKAIKLPRDVHADAKVFGRFQGNPALVKGNAGAQEIPWIGKTSRHGRFRLVEKVLASLGLSSDEAAVRHVLETTWRWLIDESRIMVGSTADGYRISADALFFHAPTADWYRCERCQRLRHGDNSLPCPNPRCGGRLVPVDLQEGNRRNYYYQVLRQPMIPMRVEEHTAQLDPEKARNYQEYFKRGDINILSCSTTFEMGIDLGDLQAVILNNVPPSVANYRQRAGRAGRRAGGAAFILTWAADKPHDQLYFSDPTQIIRGHVRVPRIHLGNLDIRRRHINAILLAEFLAARWRQEKGTDLDTVGAFFDVQTPGDRHFDALKAWVESHRATLAARVRRFVEMLDQSSAEAEEDITQFVKKMGDESRRYAEIADYYAEAEAQSSRARDHDEAGRFKRLLDRQRDERLIDTLSSHGVLPSYSFPLFTVELKLPYKYQEYHLRLERDLRQAITEYAPGSEVVADKRIWKSGGLQFYRDTPKQYHYRLCRTCNTLLLAGDPGVVVPETTCPTCGTQFTSASHSGYVTPDAFRATNDSGKPAGQYVRRDYHAVRSALRLETQPVMERLGSLIEYAYCPDGRLFYVNEGQSGRGFSICMRCGTHVKQNAKQCTGHYRGEKCNSTTDIRTVMLGHQVKTDTLHLSLQSASHVNVSPHDPVFWNTLLYALLQGASHALQIERSDIDGVLYPIKTRDSEWRVTIALYDTVPGGAGHVRDIKDHLREVARAALKVVNCSECGLDASCVHCLRDYGNQTAYPLLKRGKVIPYLEALVSDLDSASRMQRDAHGMVRVTAVDQAHWLVQKLSEARRSVWLSADAITLEVVDRTRKLSWVDILRDLTRRGVDVTLLLTQLPQPQAGDWDSISLARHLQLLLEGSILKLYHVEVLPQWQAVIDPTIAERRRAIRCDPDGHFRLDSSMRGVQLVTTSHPDAIEAAVAQLQAQLPRVPVTQDRFNMPPEVRVYDIRRMIDKSEGDIEPIQKLFDKPVKEMEIHDPYLYDRERLVRRAGAYVDLAKSGGELKRVVIHTQDADRVRGDRSEQNRAIEELKRQFPDVAIEVRRKTAEHDRWIIVTRPDRTRARMVIGRGLDFIRSDRSVEPTYIVIQDPLRE